MKKFIIPSLALLLFLASCDVRKHDKKINVPALSRTSYTDTTSVQIIDSVYDFGSVKEGDIVEYNFRFKNTGNKPLIIFEATASCGCTVPEKPEHPVKPGEIGFLKVKFNSDRKPGEAHKSISISSNANPEFPVLFLKGTVIGKTEEEKEKSENH